jgi:hypothetical protein
MFVILGRVESLRGRREGRSCERSSVWVRKIQCMICKSIVVQRFCHLVDRGYCMSKIGLNQARSPFSG